jgi:hypothetical protein
MGFEVVVPNLSIPGDGGRFEAPFHCRQVNLCPIVGDEGVCSGWLGFGLANGNHVLITKCKHGVAGYRIVLCIAVTQFMGNPLLLSLNHCGVAHEEAVASFVDRASLIVSGRHSTCQ